ncbi:MAG: tRNA uridine-5-carboxymethylaminomethyl(34) synthesis GTPase MnmE [Desulfuromonadaceae bacterium]|nr:tRNA uridine-5-carboxymethylaminomethyl(34) synthesis GTPase MnmE [Desulfuromonadaceae bacterium]MDD5104235.1 tRNA uridine-5-carboxymethylaminomethyl(34) synthesis GTPase MnmE [Desulfuromonadaceae bacterium]
MYIRDTIAAVSTPPGNGGIGIIRISGPQAAEVGHIIFRPIHDGGLVSHRFSFGTVCDGVSGTPIDEAMAVFMRAPRSYTREDVLELHCHGGWLIVEKVLALALSCGVRLADPGEFTRRAFLNGRIDLIQAEAVMDIIASNSEAALQLAQQEREGSLSMHLGEVREQLLRALSRVEAYIDFPEDDLGETDVSNIVAAVGVASDMVSSLLSTYDDGRVLRDGVSVLIVGKPNAGKSSLLNRLLDEERAIVTHFPGTTRDIIEETVNFGGLAVRLLDTAGIRHTEDFVEQTGISRTLAKIPQADLVLAVFDSSRKFDQEDQMILDAVGGSRTIAVYNKTDLHQQLLMPGPQNFIATVNIAAITGDGLETLINTVREQALKSPIPDSRDFIVLSRARHRDSLALAEKCLDRIAQNISDGNLELLALDLREALFAIGAVTGQTTTDEVLDQIFSSFCIGK